jgi:hypothetical protein
VCVPLPFCVTYLPTAVSLRLQAHTCRRVAPPLGSSGALAFPLGLGKFQPRQKSFKCQTSLLHTTSEVRTEVSIPLERIFGKKRGVVFFFFCLCPSSRRFAICRQWRPAADATVAGRCLFGALPSAPRSRRNSTPLDSESEMPEARQVRELDDTSGGALIPLTTSNVDSPRASAALSCRLALTAFPPQKFSSAPDP